MERILVAVSAEASCTETGHILAAAGRAHCYWEAVVIYCKLIAVKLLSNHGKTHCTPPSLSAFVEPLGLGAHRGIASRGAAGLADTSWVPTRVSTCTDLGAVTSPHPFLFPSWNTTKGLGRGRSAETPFLLLWDKH